MSDAAALPSVHFLGRSSSHRDILSLRMNMCNVKFGVGENSLAIDSARRVLVVDSPDDAPAANGGGGGDIRVQTDVLIGLLLLSPRASVNISLHGARRIRKKKKKKKK
jgi:hypothetical protein